MPPRQGDQLCVFLFQRLYQRQKILGLRRLMHRYNYNDQGFRLHRGSERLRSHLLGRTKLGIRY